MERNEHLNASKESIKRRMLKHAAHHWGIPDADIDSFDPVLGLLIESCATEVFKISNEISTAQVRVLRRLARLLTPDVHTGPRPSHAIAQARSTEPEMHTRHTLQFSCTRKAILKPGISADEPSEFFFTPAGTHRLVDGTVRYLAAGGSLFSVSEGGERELVTRTRYGQKLPSYTLWIGMELNQGIGSLKDLRLYVDWKNQPDKQALYHSLPLARVYNGIKPLRSRIGWEKQESHQGRGEELFSEFSTLPVLEEEVRMYYQDRFITITEEISPAELAAAHAAVPEDLRNAFEKEDVKNIGTGLFWLKVVFPHSFPESLLEDVVVLINCFPVMNRRLHELRYSLQQHFNIVPLLSDEQFLAVMSVTGSDGTPYFDDPGKMIDAQEKGIYSLREGGVERFDERNAAEMLQYLMELLRDESAAFSAFGQNFIASLIREFNQNIALMEQRVRSTAPTAGAMPSYLMIRPRNDGEQITVEFWSTQGEAANGIRAGSSMQLYSGADLVRDSIRLLSVTAGGKNRLNANNVLRAYKNAVLTRGRIVTEEDIRSLCRHELGDRLQDVEVRRGIAVGALPNEGLIRTLDVVLTPADSGNKEEWDAVCQYLQNKLEHASLPSFHYRVIVAG